MTHADKKVKMTGHRQNVCKERERERERERELRRTVSAKSGK